MRKPFWLIDGRLREAAYFFDGMAAKHEIDEARHHFSAFLSAFASVFDAIDRTLRDIDGFLPWWDESEARLLTDATVAYLWKIRNQVIHEGLNPLGIIRRTVHVGTSEALLLGEWLPLSENNARMVCGRGMFLLARACTEAYDRWWTSLDLPNEATLEELAARGLTLEAIELELGLPAGWSDFDEATPEDRLRHLRRFSQTVTGELLFRLQVYQPPDGIPRDDSLLEVIARRRKARHRYAERRSTSPAG